MGDQQDGPQRRALQDFLKFTALIFSAFLVIIVVHVFQKVRQRPRLRSVAILVLGDVGRSPRMMYHAESFARLEFNTYLIGYRGQYC
jgi:beta-1,4-mannosyltransferase